MFALYLHIPFCLSKCPYCDFNSYAGSTLMLRDQYVDALCSEIAIRVGQEDPTRIDTIFFGGGTPSLLEGAQVQRILDTIRAHATLADDCEISLEANPGTLVHDGAVVETSLAKLEAFRAAGVNRLSFGVQSLHEHHLRTLGRWHSADEAIASYRLARAAGFDNLNLDFIFAVPRQTVDEWAWTLERAVELAPEHLSCYGLTIEEGTPFFDLHQRGVLRSLDEDTELAMFELTRNRLAVAGYEPYEVSNFAVSGRRCRHNQVYWNDDDFLGCGAGAHSSLRGVRSWNERNPKRYAQFVSQRGEATVGREQLGGRAKLGEAMMLGLRLSDGVDLQRLGDRHGLKPSEVFGQEFERLNAAGLLELQNSHARLSSKGLLVANSVMAEFLAD